jgi:hypothetical protein
MNKSEIPDTLIAYNKFLGNRLEFEKTNVLLDSDGFQLWIVVKK